MGKVLCMKFHQVIQEFSPKWESQSRGRMEGMVKKIFQVGKYKLNLLWAKGMVYAFYQKSFPELWGKSQVPCIFK
jgi:hypothetical protein